MCGRETEFPGPFPGSANGQQHGSVCIKIYESTSFRLLDRIKSELTE